MESREEIETAAAAWIFKRDAGEWTAADDHALAAWLRASNARRVVFLRLDAAWRAAARLKALGAGIAPGVVPARKALRARPFVEPLNTSSPGPSSETVTRGGIFSKSNVFRALAASVLLTVALTAVWVFVSHRPSYRTDIGGLEGVAMIDGSHVTLNTASEVRIAVTDTERRVDLEQGEAFFEVAKDPARPFVVVAGEQRVIAVGTKFSVRRERDEVRVVVSEGRVRIQRGGAGAQASTAELTAGNVARSAGQGLLVQKKPLSEVEQYLSWRNGFLAFQGTALADAVAEFNRYNTRQIVIEDAQLAGLHIDGNFRANNVDAFARLLQAGFPVDIEHRDDRIIVRALGNR